MISRCTASMPNRSPVLVMVKRWGLASSRRKATIRLSDRNGIAVRRTSVSIALKTGGAVSGSARSPAISVTIMSTRSVKGASCAQDAVPVSLRTISPSSRSMGASASASSVSAASSSSRRAFSAKLRPCIRCVVSAASTVKRPRNASLPPLSRSTVAA